MLCGWEGNRNLAESNGSLYLLPSQTISWFSNKKLNLTQQAQTFIHNKIYYNTK